MADALIILPSYNECESIRHTIALVRAAVPNAAILVIDDASPDGTGLIADSIAEEDPAVSVLHRAGKEGLGRAYLAGFAWALGHGYDYVVEMDMDGSHPASDLPAMLQLARDGADLVLGSRWIPGGRIQNWPALRQAISRVGNAYSRFMLRSRINDLTAGFRVIRADSVRTLLRLDIASQGYCFQVETAWRLERAGAIIAQHPITFVEREHGSSKMHVGIVAEALWRVTVWGAQTRLRGRGQTVAPAQER